jgi:hypothetical protein
VRECGAYWISDGAHFAGDGAAGVCGSCGAGGLAGLVADLGINL